MKLIDASLVERRRVSRDMWVLAFEAAEVAAEVKGGQFVNLGLGRGFMLRRPFSVYRAMADRIEVILKAVGPGTAALIEMKERETVSCLGPLGRGFDFSGEATTAVLISGG